MSMIKILLLFSALLFFSCTTVSKVDTEEPFDEKEVFQPSPVKKEYVSDKIILQDFYSGKKYTLRDLSMNRQIFMEVTASWCEACKDLKKVSQKLKAYYKEAVLFVRVYLPGDTPPEHGKKGDILEMEIVSSPEDLSIESGDTFPRVFIFSAGGEDVKAVVDGIYPILIYHGMLAN